MEQRIVGFAGEMGSGKGTATELLKRWYPGTPSFRFSDSLREIYAWFAKDFSARYGAPHHFPDSGATKDLQDISTKLREIYGEDLLERAIIARASKCDTPLVIIEGIRRLVDISTLMKTPSFRFYYIDADPKIRWERHRTRNEKPGDADLSFADFMKLGEAEAEQQIRLLKPSAHCVFMNNGTIAEFAFDLQNEFDPGI